MIFIRWTDGFNPNKKTNKMTTISGVSKGVQVIDDYEVGIEERDYNDRNKYIFWNKSYKYSFCNGFAKTNMYSILKGQK